MRQDEFGYRIRQALEEGAQRLDYKTLLRLERARAAALARQRTGREAPVWVPALQTAGAGLAARDDASGRWTWMRRFGLVAPLLALVIGVVAIDDWQQSQRIREMADLDFAVLLDEAPLDAYADEGFGVLLQGEPDRQRL